MRQLLLILSVISMTVAEIEISPASWDLKTIAHDSVHVKKFTLLNKSQEKVALAQKATGCNCIRYQLNKETLPANETAEVIVTVAPRGQTGDFTWQVPIRINSDREIAISVRAKIRKKYLFYPTQINLGTAKKGKGLSASLLVMSSTQADFIIDNITSSHKSLTTAYQKKIIEDFYPGTQTGYEVTVQLQDDIDFGRHSEYLTIHTNMAENKTFKVPVFVYITGDITAVPDYVGVGVLSKEQVATKRVTLYHNNFEKFQILDIEIPDSFVKVRTEKVIDEKYYYLYIEINAKVAPRGEFRNIIKVRTDCITQEYIPVYVHGFIK